MKEENELIPEIEHGENEDIALSDFEHGALSTEEAFEQLAKALGKNPEEVNEIWGRGSDEALTEKLKNAEKDNSLFEELAALRGISKEEIKEEMLWALKKANEERLVAEILEENPEIPKETALELAKLRLGAQKEKEEPEKEDFGKKLEELDEFIITHRGEAVEALAGEVLDAWEKGIPLEEAYKKFELLKQNETLAKEMEVMKQAKLLEEQKLYAKNHTPGSASTAADTLGLDEFAAGLFREY